MIRFKTESTSELFIPREELLDNNKYLYTGHGFTSGKQGRIGAPEFKFRNQFYVELNDGGFVFSKDYLDDVVKEAKGNMRVIEQKLGLEFGFLNDNDVMIVLIKKGDFINPRFPTGNEIGVNNLWIPGGLTSSGIPELVMDFSLRPKFSEIKIH